MNIVTEIHLSDYLTERKERIKPKQANIMNLPRIKKITFNGEIQISFDQRTNTDMILVKPGDLVISGINVAKGALGVYEGEVDALATIHYSSYNINEKIINRNFFTYLIKSHYFLKLVKNLTTGGIKTEIKANKFLSIAVPIPELKIQREIFQKTDLFHNKLKSSLNILQYCYDLVEKLKDATLHEAFTGKMKSSGVTKKDIGSTELLETILQDHYIRWERLQIIKGKDPSDKNIQKAYKQPKNLNCAGTMNETIFPSKWISGELKDLVYFAGRIGWKGLKASEYKEQGPLFLSAYNINEKKYVDLTNVNHISDERYEESPEITLQNGDILLVKDGSGIGKLGIVYSLKNKATINSSLLLIRCGNSIITDFLYYYLNGPVMQNIVKQRISGIGTPHLYQKEIKKFILGIPDKETQMRIINTLDKFFEYYFKIKKTLQKRKKLLIDLENFFMTKYFSDSIT